jgi:GH18 family chitinase
MKKNLLRTIILFLFLKPWGAFGQEFKTVGYLPTYRFGLVDKMELERLTHLNISFANPDQNGILQTNGVDISDAVYEGHKAGVEVFIALAGGAASLSDWEKWITPENRSEFISGIIEYAKFYKLQGVDVDIEWGVVNDDYSGFVLELKDSLVSHDLQMSAALPAIYRYPEITAEALASFDWINLMAYDLTGPWQPDNMGSHSPYSLALNSIDYWSKEGLEKKRMTLGVPFYGWDFTDRKKVKSATFANLVKLDPANAYKDRVGDIFYNGIPTITKKTLLALNEVSGVMIWEIGQDDLSDYSLLQHIDELIGQYQTNSILSQEEVVNMSIYPNPVLRTVTVNTGLIKGAKISVLSAMTQLIYSTDSFDLNEVSIDMSSYSSGIYFIVIEKKGFRKAFKVVKI